MTTKPLRTIAIVLLTAAGCGPDTDEAAVVVPTDSASTVTAPAAILVPLPQERIYYTLTDHPWYAQGGPLLHENVPHKPNGRPVAASADAMEKAGEYEGVEYYRRTGDSEPVLYIPVFEGYWQRFQATASPPVN